MKETAESILNDQLGGTLQTGKQAELFRVHQPRDMSADGVFAIIEKDEKFAVAIGQQLGSDWKDTKEECERMIETRDIKLLCTLMLAMINYDKK